MDRNWRHQLAELIRSSDDEIVVAVPYISQDGADFVLSHLSEGMKTGGCLKLITDLSPMPICQGSTDPDAIRSFAAGVSSSHIFHLPRLHAKVYVSGTERAIITSGNLTRNGLYHNYEYGICIDDPTTVAEVRKDVLGYTALGAPVSTEKLRSYCEVAEIARSSFQKQLSKISSAARKQFKAAFEAAEEELIQLRLAKGAMHTVFEDAILFFLKRDGPLSTRDIHLLIEGAYPDLCDNSVDRVIDGIRFGKRWKHAVRTAQQHLKRKALIDLVAGRWRIEDGRN